MKVFTVKCPIPPPQGRLGVATTPDFVVAMHSRVSLLHACILSLSSTRSTSYTRAALYSVPQK